LTLIPRHIAALSWRITALQQHNLPRSCPVVAILALSPERAEHVDLKNIVVLNQSPTPLPTNVIFLMAAPSQGQQARHGLKHLADVTHGGSTPNLPPSNSFCL
jgi:hypothetical protein